MNAITASHVFRLAAMYCRRHIALGAGIGETIRLRALAETYDEVAEWLYVKGR